MQHSTVSLLEIVSQIIIGISNLIFFSFLKLGGGGKTAVLKILKMLYDYLKVHEALNAMLFRLIILHVYI